MNYKKILLIFLLLFSTLKIVNAQTFTGCLIYDGGTGNPLLTFPLYVTPTGANTVCNGYTVAVYTTPTQILNKYCSITPFPANAAVRDPNQSAYNPFFPSLGGRNPDYRSCTSNVSAFNPVGSCGIITTITLVPCPLDDYVWPLILVMSAFMFHIIRNRISTSI